MASTTLKPPEMKPSDGGSGPGGIDWGGEFGGDSYSGPYGPARQSQVCRTGIWLALAAIVMFFAALTSALVVRRGLSADWTALSLPGMLRFTTLLLLASSLTLEVSRRALARGMRRTFMTWWTATIVLGLGFIAGQYAAWREMVSRGFYLATNPSSAFFYLLTAAHAVHVFGGIGALIYVTLRARLQVLTQAAVDVSAIYWHFMDGLWLYLFLLLLWGR